MPWLVPYWLNPGHQVHMSATLDEGNVGGYSVAYGRDDIYFPVYITAALALIFLTAAWINGEFYWLPLGTALVVDWRKKQPAYRLLMRLPWRMSHDRIVRVNLEPFDQPPDAIHRTFL